MNAFPLPLAPEPLPRPLGLKGPRADVVMELKRSGPLPAKEIVERVGLSMNAVRHHLKELEAGGLVGYERHHRGGGAGAPSFVYRLTPAGEALFPRRYEDAVARLLDYVIAREGRQAAVEVLESRYRELADRLRGALANASPEERVTAVARALAEDGYMPEGTGEREARPAPGGAQLPDPAGDGCASRSHWTNSSGWSDRSSSSRAPGTRRTSNTGMPVRSSCATAT